MLTASCQFVHDDARSGSSDMFATPASVPVENAHGLSFQTCSRLGCLGHAISCDGTTEHLDQMPAVATGMCQAIGMHSQPVHRQRSSNASLLVNSDAGSSTFTAPGLSLADSGGSTVQFDLNTASLPTAPLMNISGINGLNLNGDTHTLYV
jgi:hypothetical protein